MKLGKYLKQMSWHQYKWFVVGYKIVECLIFVTIILLITLCGK